MSVWSQPKGPSLKDLIRAGELTVEQAEAGAPNASESTKRKWRKAAKAREKAA